MRKLNAMLTPLILTPLICFNLASKRVYGLRRERNEHGQNDGERDSAGEKNGAPSPCNYVI
jgi:hypothetical protein